MGWKNRIRVVAEAATFQWATCSRMSLGRLLLLLLCVVSARWASGEEQQQQQQQSRLSLPMKHIEIAPGVEMPVISIGTGGKEHEKAYEIVSNWLELGGRGIDTALIYNNQPIIRQAIENFNRSTTTARTISRSDLFVTTKIPDCNSTKTASYVQRDLDELSTQYLDLVLLHVPRNGDCVEAWKVLERFYLDHRIKAIGVSNFHRKDLEPLLKDAMVVPAVNQIQLNVGLKRDSDTIDFCTQQNIVIQAYSPLGRNDPNNDVVGLEIVQSVARAHNVSPYQVALKWILQHGWILTVQSISKKHQAIDADVFGWELTRDEMKKLDSIAGSKQGMISREPMIFLHFATK